MTQDALNVTFLYMPIDGVAAYWLSLRKLAGSSRNLKALESEAQFVSEPLVRHLLDMLISQLPPQQCRQLAEIAAEGETARLDRQLDLMRVAILDIASGENPLRTLAKFTARFASPMQNPESMLENAQSRVAQAVNMAIPPETYRIDHFMSDEQLAATLLVYTTLGRKHGKAACRNLLPQEGSLFFTDALSLVVDGFDGPFVRKWMKKSKDTLIEDMHRKMRLSIDMCAAIHNRVPFEEMRFLVRSYIR